MDSTGLICQTNDLPMHAYNVLCIQHCFSFHCEQHQEVSSINKVLRPVVHVSVIRSHISVILLLYIIFKNLITYLIILFMLRV